MTLDKHTNHLMTAKAPMPANYKHSLHWGLREYDLQSLKAKCKVQNAVTNSRWTAGQGGGSGNQGKLCKAGISELGFGK